MTREFVVAVQSSPPFGGRQGQLEHHGETGSPCAIALGHGVFLVPAYVVMYISRMRHPIQSFKNTTFDNSSLHSW